MIRCAGILVFSDPTRNTTSEKVGLPTQCSKRPRGGNNAFSKSFRAVPSLEAQKAEESGKPSKMRIFDRRRCSFGSNIGSPELPMTGEEMARL